MSEFTYGKLHLLKGVLNDHKSIDAAKKLTLLL
jgi:hypothetical protein